MSGDSSENSQYRLPPRLAETLKPELHDALDHLIRREVLRVLNRNSRTQRVPELKTKIGAFRLAELSYHLQVLWRSGAVACHTSESLDGEGTRYASEVSGDRQVCAVLRATEQRDRGRREAAAAAEASPLLTMFRVPRPVRTIRLRSQREVESERDR
jgi:hypothetical protein